MVIYFSPILFDEKVYELFTCHRVKKYLTSQLKISDLHLNKYFTTELSPQGEFLKTALLCKQSVFSPVPILQAKINKRVSVHNIWQHLLTVLLLYYIYCTLYSQI